MQRSQPFARAIAMASMIAAAMAANPWPGLAQQAALSKIGDYESRGKGGKEPHRRGNGSIKVKRAARKARNVRRHRAACR